MKNGDEPAHPTIENFDDGRIGRANVEGYKGLTKREYFAGLAMPSVHQSFRYNGQDVDPIDVARLSVEMADALLKELEK